MSETIETEFAIIGGGIAGVSAALFIAARDRKVVLLEKDFVGSKASGVNFGGCRTNGRDLPELPLSLRAQTYWHRFDEIAGHWCDYRMTGHLDIAHDEQNLAVFERWAGDAAQHGVKAEMISARQLQARFPYISRRIHGGCFVADNGSANPRLVMPNLARRARANGATIIEYAPVIAVDAADQAFTLHTNAGHRIKARTVIHATGGYAALTANALFGETFPVEQIIPQMMVSEPIGVRIDPVLDYQLGGRSLYLRQVERGNILFGRGSGSFDNNTDRASYHAINMFNGSAVAANVIPALEGINIIRTWGGLDGAMPDDLPVMGFSKTIPNLIHGFGFSGHGFQLGPASGAVLAELALDGCTETDISGFKVDRFTVQRS